MASTTTFSVTNTLESGTINDPSEVNTNFSDLVSALNDAFDTSSGHTHDGTDSAIASSLLNNFTEDDVILASIHGIFSKRGQ
jgi:hypothetical protein